LSIVALLARSRTEKFSLDEGRYRFFLALMTTDTYLLGLCRFSKT